MQPLDLLFYVFALLTVGPALGVVLTRNTVHAAFLLILSFVGLASLFFLLEAYFLAVLQILVYAGAVVVLFLFIIMLLDVPGRAPERVSKLGLAARTVGILVLLCLLAGGAWSLLAGGDFTQRPLAGTAPVGSTLAGYGQALFTRYLLPLQMAGFLLLVAMIGVIVLSKRWEAGTAAAAAGTEDGPGRS